MNFDLSEEQVMLQETVKQYLENECPPNKLREIFDGDAPHTPNGCIAQAWTVAEALRAWQALSAH